MKNHHLAFSIEPNEYGDCSLLKFDIDTGDTSPICIRPRRIPFHLREVVEKEIDSLEKEKTIRQTSSPWSAPLVVVGKKSGE